MPVRSRCRSSRVEQTTAGDSNPVPARSKSCLSTESASKRQTRTSWFRPTLALVLLIPLLQAPAVRAQETEAATRQYAVAVGFQNQKLFDSAIDEWNVFLKKFPKDPRIDRAQHYLGTCCLQEQRFDEAIAAFTKVAATSPQFELLDQTLLNLGIAQYGKGQKTQSNQDFASADATLNRMLARFAESEYAPRALFYLGESLFQQKKTAEAAQRYEELLKRFPQHELAADALYALGTSQESLNRTEDAAATFTAFATRYPRHSLVTEVQMRHAELLFRAGQFKTAEPLFAAISNTPAFELADVAMLRQARCLYEQDRLEEAARVYWDVPRRFAKTTHYDAATLAGAKCLFLLERYDTARDGFEKVAGRNVPEAAEATQWLSRTWLRKGDAAKALKIADDGLRKFRSSEFLPDLQLARLDALYETPSQRTKIVREYAEFAGRNPKHPQAGQALYMAALSALDVQDFDGARTYSDQFLSSFREHSLQPDVMYIVAESSLLQRRFADAQQRFRTYLKAAPQHANAAQAKVRLGLAMFLAEQPAEAEQWLSSIVGSLTEPALRSEALSLIGRSQLNQKKIDVAVKSLTESLAADPKRSQNDETLLALADALRQAGQSAEATSKLQQLIRDYPQSPLQAEAWFRRGEATYADGNVEQAIKDYNTVISRWPQSEFAEHARYGEAWAQFNAGHFQSTIDATTELLRQKKESPVSDRALYLRAMAQFQLGEHERTLRDIDAFLATGPAATESLDAKYVQGLALAGLKKYAQAADVYSQILTSAD
ncbi:MAG: tetratricopeptide repeat protein, partial [Planctomycetaceae bacterium]|nr:tetratricopeptide repeat protein [Planctomycetaceae bacterium]